MRPLLVKLCCIAMGVSCALSARAQTEEERKWMGEVRPDPLASQVAVASVSAAVGALTYGEVGVELGLHVHPREDVRLGLWGFGSLDLDCGCGHTAAYLSVDYALRHANDVSVWLGISLGPMFFVTKSVDTTASGVLSLDIAIPLTRILALDLIFRGGLDVGSGNPQGFLSGGVGVTWDFVSHRRRGLPELAKSAEYKL